MKYIGGVAAGIAFFAVYIICVVLIGLTAWWLIGLIWGTPDTWWFRNVTPYIVTIGSATFAVHITVWLATLVFRKLPMGRVVPVFGGLLVIQWGAEAIWGTSHLHWSYLQGVVTAIAAIITAVDQGRKADRSRGL